jgi:hypothetical protein
MSSSTSLGSAASSWRTAGESIERPRGLADEVQRQRDEPQPDDHAPEAARARLLAADEEHHADEDQQRRQPRQVEGKDDDHHRRAHVGAQHHRQRGGSGDEPAPDEGRDDEAGGGAGLHHAGHRHAGQQGVPPVADAARDDLAQGVAEQAQHPCARCGCPTPSRAIAARRIEKVLHALGNFSIGARPARALSIDLQYNG